MKGTVTCSPELYNYARGAKNFDVLNGCSLRIYDGGMPDHAGCELADNVVVWECKDIQNDSNDPCRFEFSDRSGVVLPAGRLGTPLRPVFFRLAVDNGCNDMCIQGSYGRLHSDLYSLSDVLVPGTVFTIVTFSLYANLNVG